MPTKKLTLTIFNGLSECRRCQALSKRTGVQCAAPAERGSEGAGDKCRFHGGRSTGPKTDHGRKRCATAKTIHGRETRAIRKERNLKSAELQKLVELGNAIGLFGKRIALRGRPATAKRG